MKRLILIILLVLTSCKTAKKKLVAIGTVSDHAMVVTARKEASKVGLEILKNGGNAFDAMIATEFALAVAYPFAGSLGGGGFMVYRTNEGNIGSLDYREKAPLAATKNMFLDEKGNIINKMGDIKFPRALIPAKATSEVRLDLNLDSRIQEIKTFDLQDPYATSDFTTGVEIYDSQGNKHLVTLFFNKTADHCFFLRKKVFAVIIP